MLRPLLEQRFKLVAHNGTRPLPACALTAGKKASAQRSRWKGDTGCKAGNRIARWDSKVPVPQNPALARAMRQDADPIDGYTVFEAMKQQLGLKPEAQKRTVSVIAIGCIEQTPTEN